MTNSKMVLGLIGLIIWVLIYSTRRALSINKNIVWMVVLSVLFSLDCGLSIALNGVSDYAYVFYFASMFVWLFAGYAVCFTIRALNGKISFEILTNYLIAVCVMQCAVALLNDNVIGFRTWMDSWVEQGQNFLNSPKVHRMYGFGASLDTAGTRFSAVLCLLAFQLWNIQDAEKKKWRLLYICAFLFITVVGNMIARTTLAGVVLSLGLIGALFVFGDKRKREGAQSLFTMLFAILLVGLPIYILAYNNNLDLRRKTRFAFEGFFSLVEKGTWDVSSNETLKNMVVWPDNAKTWIIGDGYFDNPYGADPYFIGKFTGGYYMGSDVGYCRFIFYCGLLGLLTFSCFMIQVCITAVSLYPGKGAVFWTLLALNFIVWMKVSTDMFVIFAPYIMLPFAKKLTDPEDSDEESPTKVMLR